MGIIARCLPEIKECPPGNYLKLACVGRGVKVSALQGVKMRCSLSIIREKILLGQKIEMLFKYKVSRVLLGLKVRCFLSIIREKVLLGLIIRNLAVIKASVLQGLKVRCS